MNGKRFAVRLIDHNGADGARPAPARAGRAPRPAPRRAARNVAVSNGRLDSPIQGTVLRVAVEQGAHVSAGDLICVIEAMKMENEITAPRDGTVQELAVKTGETVRIGQRLATIG